MPECAIRVENLSKRYRIGRREPVSDTLAGTLLHHLTRPIDNFRRLRKLSAFSENRQAVDDILWALKGLSFEVPSGKVMGIIHRHEHQPVNDCLSSLTSAKRKNDFDILPSADHISGLMTVAGSGDQHLGQLAHFSEAHRRRRVCCHAQ